MAGRYDRIGRDYARLRREDPRFRARIVAALGGARSVVNVGAGAGSYEPRDRPVVPIEPSAVMAILSVHHWDDEQEAGIRELRRVARGPVVLLTYDAAVSGAMWLMADYLPEVATLDRRIFPSPERLADWLGGAVRTEALPIPRDTPDWMLGAFWAHPERVLDPAARAATSGFARMPGAVVARVEDAVRRDLASGAWDARHGHLRTLDVCDVGLRLVVGDGQ